MNTVRCGAVLSCWLAVLAFPARAAVQVSRLFATTTGVDVTFGGPCLPTFDLYVSSEHHNTCVATYQNSSNHAVCSFKYPQVPDTSASAIRIVVHEFAQQHPRGYLRASSNLSWVRLFCGDLKASEPGSLDSPEGGSANG